MFQRDELAIFISAVLKIYGSAECAGRSFTLHHSVRGLHRGQVGDHGDVATSARALDVNIDGAFNFAVKAGHHARGICHIGHATVTVIPGEKRL